MTRYANDIQDGQLGQAGTGAVNVVYSGSAVPGGWGAPAAPVAAPAAPAAPVARAAPIAVNGAGVPIRASTAMLDIERLMGAKRGSGGAGTSLVGEEKPTPPNLMAADGPGESSAFPFAVNGEKKSATKIEPKNLAILAALAAMFLM